MGAAIAVQPIDFTGVSVKYGSTLRTSNRSESAGALRGCARAFESIDIRGSTLSRMIGE